MADFKETVQARLRAAGQWLAKAEDFFAHDRDVRAELSLMLAQAELQHVREANRSRRGPLYFPLLRHGFALLMALAILSVGFGGYFLGLGRDKETFPPAKAPAALTRDAGTVGFAPPVNAESQAALADKARMGEPAVQPVQPVQPVAAPPPAPPPASSPVYRTEAAPAPEPKPYPPERMADPERTAALERAAEKEARLSPEEMQKLIRAAGKSLRGQ